MSSNKTVRQNRLREALGRIYNQTPSQFQDYLRRYKEDPSSRVFAPLAEMYRKMGNFDQAIAVCREGLKHHPDFTGGWVALAKCLCEKKEFTEARSTLQKVVQVSPENLMAQRLLGETEEALGNLEEAIHRTRVAQVLAPSDLALTTRIRDLEKRKMEAVVVPPTPPEPTVSEENLWGEGADSEGNLASDAIETSVAPHLRWDGVGTVETEETADETDEGAVEGSVADKIFGEAGASDLDSFHVEAVSNVFGASTDSNPSEITTETLGDLYFAQGQFERSLMIFEAIARGQSSPALTQKIHACRARLGVDAESMVRLRQIEMLRSVLKSLG